MNQATLEYSRRYSRANHKRGSKRARKSAAICRNLKKLTCAGIAERPLLSSVPVSAGASSQALETAPCPIEFAVTRRWD